MSYQFRRCCDSPAGRHPHIKGCSHFVPTQQDYRADMERHNAETIPGYHSGKREFDKD